MSGKKIVARNADGTVIYIPDKIFDNLRVVTMPAFAGEEDTHRTKFFHKDFLSTMVNGEIADTTKDSLIQYFGKGQWNDTLCKIFNLGDKPRSPKVIAKIMEISNEFAVGDYLRWLARHVDIIGDPLPVAMDVFTALLTACLECIQEQVIPELPDISTVKPAESLMDRFWIYFNCISIMINPDINTALCDFFSSVDRMYATKIEPLEKIIKDYSLKLTDDTPFYSELGCSIRADTFNKLWRTDAWRENLDRFPTERAHLIDACNNLLTVYYGMRQEFHSAVDTMSESLCNIANIAIPSRTNPKEMIPITSQMATRMGAQFWYYTKEGWIPNFNIPVLLGPVVGE